MAFSSTGVCFLGLALLPLKSGSISDAFKNNYDIAVAQTPYCEWYWNAIKVPESDSAKHHAETYGNTPYQDFREPFFKGLEQWKPEA